MQNKLKSWFGPQDMTVGNPMNNLIRFSIPLVLGNFVQQMYQTADAFFVGRTEGHNGLAAVGVTMPLINFLILLFISISTGAGVMVSQYIGAGQHKKLAKTMGNTLLLVAISSALMMLIAIPGADWLLTILKTPPEIHDMAAAYLRIIFIGIAGGGYYNIISGILRAQGDAVVPLIILTICASLNVILDWLFVWGLGWGVEGAAWATIISQTISAVLCLWRLFTMNKANRLRMSDLKPDGQILKDITRLGLPAGIAQGIFSLSMVLVQGLTNAMGPIVIAAQTAVIRVDGFAMMPNFTFGMAATTYVGQNLGARRMDRVKEGNRAVVKLSLIVSIVLTVLVLIFGRTLLNLFAEDTPEMVNIGYGMLSILAVGYVAMSQSQAFGGILRGAGDTQPALWIAVLSTMFLRLPMSYILAYLTRSEAWPNGHPYTLSLSLVTSWVVAAIGTFLWYRRGKWVEKTLIQEDIEIDPNPLA